ncbi:olfactory receptor 5F1-like [Astatotilapia calliptera]|uniref:G-protein coupled receptors family 1 profile domain-containing protein n=1 Tax=Astatotilapia calliptera TaxID=8154 RepID=A0A3P8NZ85_ASTCA|nr:olfactory receptor 5F1-like [Astatotilapia calliptera]
MNNVSVITMFFLSGFNETVSHRFVLFSLSLLCYCIICLLNVSLIVIIILHSNLHEPMYILLCVFCINALYGTAGFYPKFLWDLLSDVHLISYYGCLIQTQVIYSSACGELSIPALMAYDRYVAICQPLKYHSIMSKQRVIRFAWFLWFTNFCIVSVNTFLTSRLKLCSPYISRLFCVNWSIVQLACFPAQTAINAISANITISIYFLYGVFIVWSYLYIIQTCVRSIENRAKFMQTCVPHLVSLFTFAVTKLLDIINMRLGSKELPQTLQNFAAIEFLVIPPIMNPLIYGFKLTKIRKTICSVVIFKTK